jgi:uncharacterized protein YecE (DUF72 family)
MEIKVGTSGWSFDDWVGVYYPYKLPKTDWIRFYAREFQIAEINSTYYRIASPKTYSALNLRTPTDFEFFAKLHAEVTHERKDPSLSMKAIRECLKPLMDSGKLKGFVAQFPSSFRQTPESEDYLLRLRELAGGMNLFVEFRHESWWKSEVFDFLQNAGLHYVSVDAPKLPGLMTSGMKAVGDVLYVRFHGRNAAAWWNRSKGDRYDYLYSESELQEHGESVLGFAEKVKRGYLLFNNCHAGSAIRNAKWLKVWLAQKMGTIQEVKPDDNLFS